MSRRETISGNKKLRTIRVNTGTRKLFAISPENVGILFPNLGMKKNILFSDFLDFQQA